MNNYRAWLKRETDILKATYNKTVDSYYDMAVSQMGAIACRTGTESPQELYQMVGHMADTKTLYQQQLDGLTKRYFDSKPTFYYLSSAIDDTASFTNPIIINHPNMSDVSYQVTFAKHPTTHQQQATIRKRSELEVAFKSDNSKVTPPNGDNVSNQGSPLNVHLRSRSGQKAARCTWNGCTYTSLQSSKVIRHIRCVHFKLPITMKKQKQLGIVDHRNPYDYFQKI